MAYLAALPDPAVADVTAALEPVSDIAVYRQTSNQRHHYGKIKNWPDGLLVVGDAACAFNPVYGQGMTVAALQALLLRDQWGDRGCSGGSTESPTSVGRSRRVKDLRHPTSAGEQNRMQRVVAAWSAELTKLAVTGNRRAYAAFAGVYHLMTRPRSLFHPALFVAVAWSRVRGAGQPRPVPRFWSG